jgi:hypothetical protein
MEKIQDSGKIWCKGSSSPIHAIRAENKIFATGMEENQIINCWVDRDAQILCLDLHEPKKKIRVARKFPLDLKPTLEGSLFNGFTETKHSDVEIIGSEQVGVEDRVLSGAAYNKEKLGAMNSFKFWETAWGNKT